MEVALLSKNSIKIKGKQGSIVVDPEDGVKTSSDAVVFLTATGSLDDIKAKIEGYRLVVHGSGEYEVCEIKITSERENKNLIHNIAIDGIEILLAKTESLAKNSAKSIIEAKDYKILILKAGEFDSSIIAKLTPSVVVVFGEKKGIDAKELESAKKTSKYAVTFEKLPEETEVVLLE